MVLLPFINAVCRRLRYVQFLVYECDERSNVSASNNNICHGKYHCFDRQFIGGFYDSNGKRRNEQQSDHSTSGVFYIRYVNIQISIDLFLMPRQIGCFKRDGYLLSIRYRRNGNCLLFQFKQTMYNTESLLQQ